MSNLLTFKENTIGQFTCAMRGRHNLSEKDEDKLYESETGELQTICNLCGIRVIAKIEPKHPNVYTLARVKEPSE